MLSAGLELSTWGLLRENLSNLSTGLIAVPVGGASLVYSPCVDHIQRRSVQQILQSFSIDSAVAAGSASFFEAREAIRTESTHLAKETAPAHKKKSTPKPLAISKGKAKKVEAAQKKQLGPLSPQRQRRL